MLLSVTLVSQACMSRLVLRHMHRHMHRHNLHVSHVLSKCGEIFSELLGVLCMSKLDLTDM
jgi:hypothetical protein